MKVNQIKNLETVEYSCYDCLERIDVDTIHCDVCGKPIDSNDEDLIQIPIGNGRQVIDVMKLCSECALAYQEERDALEEMNTAMGDDEMNAWMAEMNAEDEAEATAESKIREEEDSEGEYI